jgi:hypothetical protein
MISPKYLCFALIMMTGVDFTGVWIPEKTGAGSQKQTSLIMTISHSKNELKIVRSFKSYGKVSELGEVYSLDGDEHKVVSTSGLGFVYRAAWKGDCLSLSGKLATPKREVAVTYDYELEPGKDILKITETSAIGGRQVVSVSTYRRRK